MAKKQTSNIVRIRADLYQQLQRYKEATGVAIGRATNEAVQNWIERVMPGRLEALRKGAKTK